MSQTNWIAAFLIVGFIVYITVKGQIPQFATIIGVGT